MSNNLYEKQANSLRFLCADMVQKASSGHPGAPMGLSEVLTVLSEHIQIDPTDVKWLNRDRLVFSGGHASSLLYSMLHLWGYDISLDDLKNFRQLGSKTPGHPEYGLTTAVEITTGPLGQGVANAVGFAMASKYAKKSLNTKTIDVINHQIYCLCGDGDLQEGISYEALSTAGKHRLSNLTIIYDSNDITIEGDVKLAWDEDIKKRFEAIGFDVLIIDGHNFAKIDDSLNRAKNSDNPTIIVAKTKIGKGAITMEGSSKTHGSPLGEKEIRDSKEKAGFNPDKTFFISSDVRKAFDKTNCLLSKKWNESLTDDIKKVIDSYTNEDLNNIVYPDFSNTKEIATRDSNHQILNSIAKSLPSFIGGSADLAPSNKTDLTNMGDFPNGRNIHFGIKEHSMGAITNAMNIYGLFRVFSATFFVFSDYMKPACRISALSNIPQHFIWTHDSIGVGEDGATHQPIEQLSQFRAMPNFYTFRPADATNIVSVPCFDLLNEQSQTYIDKIIDKNTTVIAVEMATAIEYYKYASYVINIDSFGSSGKDVDLFDKYGFTIDKLKSKIKSIVR
ncbi:MAG: transketolase [Campylobacteraceae bacterium 4484_166]|nr:MAG: transketolase [Campylobacteraceae bacterium 4484_166]